MINTPEIKEMSSSFSISFFESWKRGFNFYIEGQWESARDIFQETREFIKGYNDGPSQTLLEYM